MARVMHADLRKPEYVRWTRFLAEAESWQPEQVYAYQLEQLRRIVRHAYEGTDGYRKLYDEHGINPDTVRTLDDLKRLPFVTKEMIRDRLEEFSAPWPGRTYVTTAGSTGIPFGFYRDDSMFARELASKAHQYYRVGWKEGDRQLVFRGLVVENQEHMTYVPEFEELRCSSYHLMPEQMFAYYRKACEYRPDWIRCYPSSGYIFAQFLKANSLRLPAVKGVLCASENLYDFQIEALSNQIGGRIFSHYGHYELAVLAGFCEYENTYHVLPQYGYAELIGTDGEPITTPGQVGEIVGTSFLMYATPFIRYRTRDFAMLKGWECPACGRKYQVWDRIEGRLQEFIVTARGRLISMTAINMHDDIFDRLLQFQFHQRRRGEVTFRYVARNGGLGPAEEQDVRRRLMVKLGDDVDLRLEQVRSIAPGGRGKNRFLVQELKLGCGDAR